MKTKELKEMTMENRKQKLKELKLELLKSKANASKSGNSKTKEIKKIIARILTLNAPQKKVLKRI
ncbi:MAG: 50S ribosomal protein L29 [Nanoarchaeota archaeon]|nr:50S ribosomal protein L29 [Nanoarchaeota archaeon]MBU1028308.1 50S ribosomal protein L29 [Nanoarchaeota archaeon]